MTIEKITPDEYCASCNGSGEVVDWVPYGMGNTAMYSLCDCVLDQVEDEDVEVEIVHPPLNVRPVMPGDYE